MSVERTITEAEPVERFALLAVTRFERRRETPVHSFEVLEWCKERTVDLSGDVIGEVTRNAVIRALDALSDNGLVVVEEETSPVGKGRPAYALDAPEAEILAALADDDHVGDIAESVKEE